MTPGEKPYVCYRGRKYRDIERRLENTYGEGDCVRVVDTDQDQPVIVTDREQPVVNAEQQGQMVDEDGKRFADTLLKTVQDLSRQIEVMGQRFTAVEDRQRENLRGFQMGEGSDASHHLPEHEATPHMASHAPT